MNLQARFDLMRQISGRWMCLLKPCEWAVLSMIVDLTLAEGKSSVILPFSEMLKGNAVHGGLKMSYKAVAKAAASLEKQGFVLRKKSFYGWEFFINYEHKKDTNMGIILPKVRQGDPTPQKRVGRSILYDKKGNEDDIELRNNEILPPPKKGVGVQHEDSQPTSAKERLRHIEERVIARTKENFAAKISEVKLSRLSIGSRAKDVWEARTWEHHGQARPKGIQMKLLSGYALRYSERRGDFLPYLEWVIEEWATISTKYLGWMKPRPEFPCIKIFVHQSDKFEQAWAGKDEMMRRANMTPHERMVALNKQRGMTEEAATRAADKETGLNRKIEEAEAKLKEAQSVLQTAVIAQKKGEEALIRSMSRPAVETISNRSPRKTNFKARHPFGEYEDRKV